MSLAVSERALLLAPRGRDAAVAAAMLAEAGISSAPCDTVPELLAEIVQGVGFVVATEEALATADLSVLSAWIGAQEEWSDLPFILLTTRGGGLERNPSAARFLGVLGNVTFLERPFHPTTLISVAQSALRGRRRQYEARARLADLREAADRYRSLFESIDAGFCIIEVAFAGGEQATDYRFLEVNPAFVRQTGLAGAEGRWARDLVPDLEPHWFERYGRVALTGQSARFEDPSDAMGRWFDVHAFRVGPPDARRVAILFNDITARRGVEEALRELTASLEQRVALATAERETALAQLHEAQKLETLGQLTGGVAHDFNNLLTPITGALDLLQGRYGEQDARAARLIDGALESAERARTLVQRLLGFARRQALQTRAVDVGALLDGMRDLIVSSIGRSVELVLDPGENLPPALADPNQLELALLNLCVNARDAMPGGGRLTMGADLEEVAAGVVPGLAPGPYVRLSVVDDGEGMDEATLARAVEPFYSTKEVGKGTGLGLSMVHGLASQLGGGFRLSSVVGQGTRADLWLPLAAEPTAQVRAGGSEAPGAKTPALSILVVDDEELVRSATAEMLRAQGHRVITAFSGPQALERLGEADVVVTDYKMPGMNGAELAERVHALRPDMPVLLITGYTGPAEEAPALPRLDKPFRAAELAGAVAELVRTPAGPDAERVVAMTVKQSGIR